MLLLLRVFSLFTTRVSYANQLEIENEKKKKQANKQTNFAAAADF